MTGKKEVSDDENDAVDRAVSAVLKESHLRVEKLLADKEKELRELAQALYEYDYLDDKEIEKVVQGGKLQKEPIRDFNLL